MNPLISIMIIGSILTIIVFLINKFAVNRKMVKELKDRMEEIRDQLTQAQKSGDKDASNNLLSEMMKINGQYMRQTFRALIISLIVISLFLPWLGHRFGGMTVANLPFDVPVLGNNLSWIYWYILVSFAIGWILNKLLGY